MKRYYIPLPSFILIPYSLVKRTWRLITLGWPSLSKRDRSVLRWRSLWDHPIRIQDRRVRYFRDLEHAIETGQPVTLSYVNISQEQSQRKIIPRRLFRRKEVIYCEAFDTLHEEYRVFRLDRMGDLKIGVGDKSIQQGLP